MPITKTSLSTGQASALPENARLFLIKGVDDALCSCPEYLGCVQIGSVSQSRGAPTEQRVYNCNTGRYDVLRTWAGNLDRGSIEVQQVLDLENGLFLDWLENPCAANLVLVYGQCTAVSYFDEGEYYWVFENVYPTDYSTDGNLSPDLFDEDDPKRIIREVLSTSWERQSRWFIGDAGDSGLTITTAARDVLFARSTCYGNGCGNPKNPDVCGELFVLDDSGGTSVILTSRCLCSGGQTSYDTGRVVSTIGIAPRGLIFTNTELTVGPFLNYTNWNYLPFTGLCDGNCLNDRGYVLQVAATVLETLGSGAFIGGAGGHLSWFSLDSGGSTNFISTGTSITEDVVAIGMYDQSNAWVGGTNGYIAHVTARGLVTSKQTAFQAGLGGTDTITAVAGVGPNTLIVGTDSGLVLRSLDGGDTWTQACTDCALATMANVIAIEQASSQVFYAVAEDGSGNPYVFVSYDGFCSCKDITAAFGMTGVTALAVCPNQPNTIALAGDDAAGNPAVITS